MIASSLKISLIRRTINFVLVNILSCCQKPETILWAILVLKLPTFRCTTLDCSDQTNWVAHWWRGATQNTWSGKRLSRTMVWTMVALRSDQRANSHYSLIIVRTKVWTMVALRTNQRTKSYSSLIIGRTKVWTVVALQSDQRPKSGHEWPQNLTTEL